MTLLWLITRLLIFLSSVHMCTSFIQQRTSFLLKKYGQSVTNPRILLAASNQDENIFSSLKTLWDEIIEVSTYGPSERKMLKAQRERQKQFEEGQKAEKIDGNNRSIDFDNDDEWLEAFSKAKEKKEQEENDDFEERPGFDGYALRDMLCAKWGAPLDVDFQKIGGKVYCTVLPLLGFGSPLRSRHETELDYLMHLQGVIEILNKYDNLEYFVSYIESTEKTPKRGTDSVPVRLMLTEEQISQIL